MSEDLARGARDFSKYDTMPTEELEEILRLDADAPEGQESDTELLLYVMALLASRDNANQPGDRAQKAWESFQQHYLPEEEMCSEAAKHTKTVRSWLPRLIAAAVIVALLAAMPLAAGAFGWGNFWNAVARWAKETFSFVTDGTPSGSDPSPSNTKEYTALQEALAMNNKATDIVPTKIPERFVLDQVVVDEKPLRCTYYAFYQDGEQSLKITVQAYMDTDPEKVEGSGTLLEVYPSDGIEYQIFSNLDQLQAVWIVDSYECYISGDLTVEEIKVMIDSIGKG